MKRYKTEQHLDLFDLNPKLSEIRSILLAMENLVDQLQKSPISIQDKSLLKNLIKYQFNSKIRQAFEGMETFKASLQKPCATRGKVHKGVPDEYLK